MIKVFLKHHIYEKCIKVIFNAIGNNFSQIPKYEFKEGQRLKQVTYGSGISFRDFYGVTIIAVTNDHIDVEFNEIYYYEEVSYYNTHNQPDAHPDDCMHYRGIQYHGHISHPVELGTSTCQFFYSNILDYIPRNV